MDFLFIELQFFILTIQQFFQWQEQAAQDRERDERV